MPKKNSKQGATGIVFNIQRYTVHDGPGIRTEIFLKGCNLRCQWCSNPESQRPHPEVAVQSAKCIGTEQCGECQRVCKAQGLDAIIYRNDKIHSVGRTLCNNCLACATSCPSDALWVFGKTMTVDEVLQIVVADKSYYGEDGGVTFSGGEAFQQREFLNRCLSACKKQGIHTCVESALHVPWATIEALLAHIDMMICDLKIMDAKKHRRLTGKSNSRILKNMSSLAERGTPLIIRVPVVPGYNDDASNITETARFIDQHLGNHVLQVQLLRYRPLGIEKYKALSMAYPMIESPMPTRGKSEHRIEELAALMNKLGVPAVTGTTYPVKKPF